MLQVKEPGAILYDLLKNPKTMSNILLHKGNMGISLCLRTPQKRKMFALITRARWGSSSSLVFFLGS